MALGHIGWILSICSHWKAPSA